VTVTLPGVQDPVVVTADGDGNWTLTTPSGANAGTVTVTATDPAGNTSEPTQAELDVTSPSVTVTTANGTQVAGKSDDPTATVTVTWPDGSKSAPVPVNADGTWTVPTPPGASSGAITVTVTDPSGNATNQQATLNTANLNTPVITTANADHVYGTADPGTKVTLTWPDGTTSTTDVAADGTWGVPTPAGMGSGTPTVVATDEFGNVSPQGTGTLDTSAPAAPALTAPAADAQVSNPRPALAGTGEDGATVTVTDGANGPVVCYAVVANGVWSCTPSTPLGEGTHALVAAQTDVAGNASVPAAPVTVTVDLSAPSAPAVNVPALTDTSTPTLTGTGEDGATVTVTDGANGPVLCTTTVANGVWSCASASLGDGDHALVATQTDPAGNHSAPSAPVTLHVDTSAPADPVVTTANARVIAGTAEPGATVTVTLPGVPEPVKVTADGDGNWSVATPAGATAGELTVTATDPAGNTSLDTKAPLDVTPPTAAVVTANATQVSGTSDDLLALVTVTWPGGTTSDPVAVKPDGTWSVPTPAGVPSGDIVVTVTDTSGNQTTQPGSLNVDKPGAPVITTANADHVSGTALPRARLLLTFPDGTPLTTTVGPDGVWSAPTPAGMGSGPLTAVATDESGNTSPDGTGQLDTSLPDAPVVTSPAPGVTKDATPAIAGTAEPLAQIAVTDNGAPFCTATADASGAWTCQPPAGLDDGTHAFAVTQTDLAGNPSAPSAPVTTTVDTAAPDAPVVASASKDATLTGTGEPGAAITVTDKAGNEVCHTEVVNGAWSCAPTTPLPQGNQTLTVTATDAAGNTSDPTPFAVTVDTQPPAAPVVKIANSTTIAGTAEPGATVSVTVPGVAAPLKVTADGNGKWSIDTPVGATGGALSVTATDPAGNTSTATITPLDATAPVPPTLDPTNGKQVTGVAEPGSTVTVQDGAGQPVPGCTDVQADPVTGRFTCTPSTPLADGAPLVAVAIDPAGNVSAPSQQQDVGAPWVTDIHPRLYRGNTQGSSGGGWVPGETITITVHSRTLNLGTVTAGPDGRATGPLFKIPSDFTIGTHTIVWMGSISGAQSVTFEVLPTPKDVQSTTGGSIQTGAPLGGLAWLSLVVVAAVLAAVWRRRQTAAVKVEPRRAY